MDILRLPASIRRSLLASPTFQRHVSTHHSHSASTPTSPPAPIISNSLPSSTISTTLPSPTPAQLKYAHTRFATSPPHLLYSTPDFRSIPPTPLPEVAFLGRSNVGKSSLLNALFSRPTQKHAHVSKRPGRTRTMNGYGILPPGQALGAKSEGKDGTALWRRFPPNGGALCVVDMPGYGAGSREEWGREVLKFLERRKHLRRTFVLVDAEHGVLRSDLEILVWLRRQGVGHGVILSKVDKILWSRGKAPSPERLEKGMMRLRELGWNIGRTVDEEAGDGGKIGVGEVLFSSAEKSLGGGKRFGIDEIRWAALRACGLECDEFGQKKQLNWNDIVILPEEES